MVRLSFRCTKKPSDTYLMDYYKELHICLKDCINHHQMLLNCCYELEQFFSPIIFVKSLQITSQICNLTYIAYKVRTQRNWQICSFVVFHYARVLRWSEANYRTLYCIYVRRMHRFSSISSRLIICFWHFWNCSFLAMWAIRWKFKASVSAIR